MDIVIEFADNEGNLVSKKMNLKLFEKMAFVYNALDDGWSVKKRNGNYIFSKPHENKKEIFQDDYISMFMKDNFDINKLLL
jgi:hypothetical protein